MKIRKSLQFCFAFLSLFYTVGLIQLPAIAVQIVKFKNGNFQPTSKKYQIKSGTVNTSLLNPSQPKVLAPSQALGLKAIKTYTTYQSSNLNTNWVFNAGNNLNGFFKLYDYNVCAPYSLDISGTQPSLPCGQGASTIIPFGESVGADFTLTYIPGQGDPQISSSNPNLFWIQIIDRTPASKTSSRSIQYLDNVSNINTSTPFVLQPTPFYPAAGLTNDSSNSSSQLSNTSPSNALIFADTPHYKDIETNYKWQASLFLAQFIGTSIAAVTDPKTNITTNITTNTVTIYNGLSWGWTSTFTPASRPAPPPSPPAPGSKGLEPPSRPREVCPPDMPPISCLAFGYYTGQDAIVDDSTPSFDDPALQIPTLADVLSPSDNTAAVLELNNASESFDDVSFQAATFTDMPSSLSSSNAAAVPEPSDALGAIVAVGMWGGISWRRRKAKALDSKPDTSRNP